MLKPLNQLTENRFPQLSMKLEPACTNHYLHIKMDNMRPPQKWSQNILITTFLTCNAGHKHLSLSVTWDMSQTKSQSTPQIHSFPKMVSVILPHSLITAVQTPTVATLQDGSVKIWRCTVHLYTLKLRFKCQTVNEYDKMYKVLLRKGETQHVSSEGCSYQWKVPFGIKDTCKRFQVESFQTECEWKVTHDCHPGVTITS